MSTVTQSFKWTYDPTQVSYEDVGRMAMGSYSCDAGPDMMSPDATYSCAFGSTLDIHMDAKTGSGHGLYTVPSANAYLFQNVVSDLESIKGSCAKVPCTGGRCYADGGQSAGKETGCECPTPYGYDAYQNTPCTTAPSTCSPSCVNGGKCVKGKCQCVGGHTGDHCQTKPASVCPFMVGGIIPCSSTQDCVNAIPCFQEGCLTRATYCETWKTPKNCHMSDPSQCKPVPTSPHTFVVHHKHHHIHNKHNGKSNHHSRRGQLTAQTIMKLLE